MTKYTLEFDKKASKEVLSLDKSTQNFILDELEKFISNFDEDYEKELLKLTKIKALQGEFKGLYRLKLRTYRVIYEKFENKLVILVLRVSHRKDVYRWFANNLILVIRNQKEFQRVKNLKSENWY